MIKQITPCLWYTDQAEEAANYYVSLFPNSKVGTIARFGKEGFEFHHMPEGSVMSVEFTLNGQSFLALNGGAHVEFNDAVSFQVFCETQEEIDHYWDGLTAGGQEVQCGWLKDKFGVSWQVIPTVFMELMKDPVRAPRVMTAMFPMKKLIIRELLEA
jgi:predicted 3-demethylubiquinone-9 3-methyltransferase (glyoxalase superfamily)